MALLFHIDSFKTIFPRAIVYRVFPHGFRHEIVTGETNHYMNKETIHPAPLCSHLINTQLFSGVDFKRRWDVNCLEMFRKALKI